MNLESLNIPKNKIKQFKNKGINCLEELIRFFPNRYYDFTNPSNICSNLKDKQLVCLILKLIYIYPFNAKFVKADFVDIYNNKLQIIWFNNSHMYKELSVGYSYMICGNININKQYNQVQIVNPLFFIDKNSNKLKKIVPSYSKIKGMSLEYLTNCIKESLRLVDNQEYLEQSIMQKFNLQNEMDALLNIHDPSSLQQIKKAKRRIIFDTLFQYQFQLEKKQQNFNDKTSINITNFLEVGKFKKNLPFQLTKDQNLVMRKICLTMKSKKKLNALLTADVGAGKTIIAFLTMIILAENGYQSVLMTPTSVLAKQHYTELKDLIKDTNYNVCLLNGNLKVRERKKILKGIENQEYNFIIGTHAVIQDSVKYNNLGLMIVDEEHRFGVMQRNALRNRSKDIHYLTMSATPIPRSLALSLYGDNTDILSIATMPNGRKPVKTILSNNKKQALELMHKEILNGHQCYFVCPLVEKSYAEAMEEIESVEEIYSQLNNYFANSNIQISKVTGKMKEEEANEEIRRFKEKETQILVATTVIEVGVNVPNSTVIVINNAERFGLAQLHQLRGRVGRSSLQSYCILVSEKSTERLSIMTKTNNGFQIAEEDLKIRGSGNLLGEEQSGQNEFIELMLSYPNLFTKIKKEIKEIYKNQERLQQYNSLFDYNIS